jgi:hypothetical protein
MWRILHRGKNLRKYLLNKPFKHFKEICSLLTLITFRRQTDRQTDFLALKIKNQKQLRRLALQAFFCF